MLTRIVWFIQRRWWRLTGPKDKELRLLSYGWHTMEPTHVVTVVRSRDEYEDSLPGPLCHWEIDGDGNLKRRV